MFLAIHLTKVVGSGGWERQAQFSKIFQEHSISGAFFYIIHIFIYFDAYILKKHAECQISCRKHENIDLTTGLMMIIKALAI